jgi:hypothetical protein
LRQSSCRAVGFTADQLRKAWANPARRGPLHDSRKAAGASNSLVVAFHFASNDYLELEGRLCRRIKGGHEQHDDDRRPLHCGIPRRTLGRGLNHGKKANRRAEYRRGYPKATEAEIQMMLDAGNKAGAVPHNLEHAKLILSDNVFALPADDSTKRFAAYHHWPVIARTMQRFVAEHPDLALALTTDATTLEKRALDAIAAGVSEIDCQAR